MHHIPIILFPPPPDVILLPDLATCGIFGVVALIALIWWVLIKFEEWQDAADKGIAALTDYECHFPAQPIHGADHTARARRFAAIRRAR